MHGVKKSNKFTKSRNQSNQLEQKKKKISPRILCSVVFLPPLSNTHVQQMRKNSAVKIVLVENIRFYFLIYNNHTQTSQTLLIGP
jgi:3-phosphoglycerate kinase